MFVECIYVFDTYNSTPHLGELNIDNISARASSSLHWPTTKRLMQEQVLCIELRHDSDALIKDRVSMVSQYLSQCRKCFGMNSNNKSHVARNHWKLIH